MEDKYQYNQKELNNDFGLLWNDYGARWYNPQLAIWHQIDPLAEKYAAWSGYNYVLGNPIGFVDPTGMSKTFYYNEGGDLLYRSNDNLPDAAVILSQTQETSFQNKIGEYAEKGLDLNADATNSSLRQLGTSYMLGGFMNAYNYSKNNTDAGTTVDGTKYDKIFLYGKSVQAPAERGVRGYAQHGGKVVVAGSPDSYYTSGKYDVIHYEDKIAGKVESNLGEPVTFNHFHPNPDYIGLDEYGNKDVLGGPGLSENDNIAAPKPGGYRNIVIDNSNIYLYNRNSLQNITIPQSWLK